MVVKNMKIQLPAYKPDIEEAKFLKSYDPLKYDRPSFTVDILVFTVSPKKNIDIRKVPEFLPRILLIKRKNYPCKNFFALPGGFVDIDESVEDAALRELKEETGLDNLPLMQLYTFGDLNRDPRYRTISTSYLCFAKEPDLIIEAGDDAAEACLFNISSSIIGTTTNVVDGKVITINTWNLNLFNGNTVLRSVIEEEINRNSGIIERKYIIKHSDLAFDHSAIILYALGKIQGLIDCTDIIFNFMDDTFTLTELQKVYEGIKLKKESKANFRRKFGNKVIPTESIKSGTGFRPPTLYKYNPGFSNISKGDL